MLFLFWCGCSSSSKRCSNNSRLFPRLLADIIKIKIHFLSLNLYHSRVNNYFHIAFYKYELFSIASNITKFTWKKISYSLLRTLTLALVILHPLKPSHAFSTPLYSITKSLKSILIWSFIQINVLIRSFICLDHQFKVTLYINQIDTLPLSN